MFLDALMRLRMSRWLGTLALLAVGSMWAAALASGEERLAEVVGRGIEGRGGGVVENVGLAQLAQDVAVLGLEETIELLLEVLDARRRDVVQQALRGDVQDCDLFLDRDRLILGLLDDLRELLAAGQLVARGLV